MLDLQNYITAIYDMGLSYNKLAGNFGVSTGTISNWIKNTTKTRIRISSDQLISGTLGCLQDAQKENIVKDDNEFIKALINNLNASDREKDYLNNIYSTKGYNSFIPYMIDLAIKETDFLNVSFDYDPTNLIRPVIGSGQDHVLAVLSNGHVRATGLNSDHQCNVASWHDVISVVGCWKGSIGLCSDGTCSATGLNVIEDGALFRWTDIAALTAGTFHVIGLKTDGTAVAFGRDPFGQCKIAEWKNIKGIAAGSNHSVGLRDDGTVVAAGKNDHGQCDVKGWKNVKQIVAAGDHTLALLSDGSVIGCGSLGSMRLDTLAGSTAIATGESHAVGLMGNGCVVNTGTDVGGLSDVERWHDMIAVSAGFSTTIGVRADGRVFVTRDKHKSFFLDTDSWKLFDNKAANQMQSAFDKALSEYKEKLAAVKAQALRVSPYISQYHDNVRILDFSLFPAEYMKLKELSAGIYKMYNASASMPTIHNIVELYLSAFCEVDKTVEEKDGQRSITAQTYEPFMDLLFTINHLEPEIRMIEEGISFPDLAEQQLSDFSPLLGKNPAL